VRLVVEGRNPNPLGARVGDLSFDLVLEGAPAATASAPDFTLAANGVPARITVDVEVPVTTANLGSLLRIARGEAVSYRLDGRFAVDLGALGRPRFGPYTLAQGTFRSPPGPPARPSFAFRADLSRLSVGAGGLVVDLAFQVTNPGAIGFRITAPLALLAGNGETVARAEAAGTVPARGSGIVYARFQADPLAAARSVIAGRFDFDISGAPTISTPGLESYSFPVSVLFGGSLRP
ncbi:MAG TPA: LEA type 2 family protein, partial [Deinococcales bacterium]|nr:LEA type 2 family protein [Deinococcales bacterium]